MHHTFDGTMAGHIILGLIVIVEGIINHKRVTQVIIKLNGGLNEHVREILADIDNGPDKGGK